MIVGGVVVVVVILIAFATMGGDETKAQVPSANAAVKTDPDPVAEPPKPVRPKSSGGSRRNLKDPDTPAPAIADGVIAAANVQFTKAKKQHDDARRAQSAGEDGNFNTLINDSWDTLQAIDGELETYTTWLEEADMESWRVPSSYDGLQQLIEKYYKLRARIKRIKPNRR